MARRLYKSKAQKRPKKPGDQEVGWFHRLTRSIAPHKRKLAIWAVALSVIGGLLGIPVKVTDVGTRIWNYFQGKSQAKLKWHLESRRAIYSVIRASAAPELEELGMFHVDEDYSRATDARELLYAMESKYPGHPDVELARCAVAGAEGNPLKALEHIKKYLALDESDPTRWGVVGQINSELGNWDEAAKAFEEVIRLGELSAWDLTIYTHVSLKQKKLDQALELSKKALNKNPHDARNDALYALCLFEQGHKAAALERVSLLLKDERRIPVVSQQIACIMLLAGKFEDAKGEFERILRTSRRPGAEVYHGYGFALLGCGQTADGVNHLEKALEMKPGDAGIENSLILGYRMKNSSASILMPEFFAPWR